MSSDEVTEEFVMKDGELTLVKKKVTKKDIPPDIKAVKLLMDGNDEHLSDEELESEKRELLKMLKEMEID